MPSPRLRKVVDFTPAAIAKLESSGLSEADAHALGIYEVPNAATLSPTFDALPGLVIPYFDATGSQPLKAHHTWPDFYRLRYLEAGGSVKGFGDVTGTKKQRYTQPPNTGVCAYLPRNWDWKAAAADHEEAVLITEGEFKASKGCAEGFPTIGLGGVYNFRASARGLFFLPELEAFTWARRKVTIVYDSDYVDKPDICAAINALAEELQERGALIFIATLPALEEDAKTGLDDFLVAKGDDALIAVLKQAEPLALSSRLWAMNDEVVYVRNPGLIVVQNESVKLAPSAFTAHSEWATASVPERKVTATGAVSVQKVPAAPAWLKWPLRKSVAAVTYRPGEPKFVDDLWNQWEGWGVEPKKGDVKPWLQLCEFIFAGADEGLLNWFYDWCAYPIQNPGAKLFSAVVVHGRMTGTGKSLIGYTLGRIYGKNFTKIKSGHLTGHFTSWAENRQFILGDEISGSDKRSEADAMKTVITQEEVSINIKNVPEYTVPDCINYYFTSNHADAFFIEDADRRYAVHEVQADEPLPREFYKAYDKWKSSTAGPAALFQWLLDRDIRDFDPKGPAFKTAARSRMANQGKSDLAIWCMELGENPGVKLRFGQVKFTRDLFTSAELLRMYQQDNEGGLKVTANGMSRAMAAAGFHQVYKGNPIVLTNGNQGRYFMVRNQPLWRKAKLKDITKHIESQHMQGVKK